MSPLLLVDIDGVLNPLGACRPAGYDVHTINFHEVWLNPDHGAMLTQLPVELVWATAWEHQANEFISPRLGLPQLPVIEFPQSWLEEEADTGLFYKTRTIVDYAAGRPFTWIDDEITAADAAWVAKHHTAPALLHHVDDEIGLTDTDVTALGDWARAAAEVAQKGSLL